MVVIFAFSFRTKLYIYRNLYIISFSFVTSPMILCLVILSFSCYDFLNKTSTDDLSLYWKEKEEL